MTDTKTHPCDEAIRSRILTAIEGGLSASALARGSVVNKTIVVQYLNPAGNTYPGTIAPYERKMAYFLDRVDLQLLAGIKTVETPVSGQIVVLSKAVRRMRIIGKAIGNAGIGKTRGAKNLDSSHFVYFVSKQAGTREAVRSALFAFFGIRGGKKTYGASNLGKYRELIKRGREADTVFVFDQAHMLSINAMHFLCEFWNDTRRGQLWLGTEDLLDRLERDEQIASRVEFGDVLKMDANGARDLIRHQIKSILPEVNGELASLTKQCETLAGDGRFRRVEMRLGNMLYLSEAASNKDKTWCELFEDAEGMSSNAFAGELSNG
jgi:DNA transposition AAA+ family ATPase